jgi:hypothetical protein
MTKKKVPGKVEIPLMMGLGHPGQKRLSLMIWLKSLLLLQYVSVYLSFSFEGRAICQFAKKTCAWRLPD